MEYRATIYCRASKTTNEVADLSGLVDYVENETEGVREEEEVEGAVSIFSSFDVVFEAEDFDEAYDKASDFCERINESESDIRAAETEMGAVRKVEEDSYFRK